MYRMRTINEAFAEIKNADPNTCLTKNALRRLVLSGVIPHTPIGNKRLISMETLEQYLQGKK